MKLLSHEGLRQDLFLLKTYFCLLWFISLNLTSSILIVVFSLKTGLFSQSFLGQHMNFGPI